MGKINNVKLTNIFKVIFCDKIYDGNEEWAVFKTEMKPLSVGDLWKPSQRGCGIELGSNDQKKARIQRAGERTLEKEGKTKLKGSKKKLYLFMEQKGGQFSGLRNQREESTEKGMGPNY